MNSPFFKLFYKWHDVRDRELFNAVRHCTLTGADYSKIYCSVLSKMSYAFCMLHYAVDIFGLKTTGCSTSIAFALYMWSNAALHDRLTNCWLLLVHHDWYLHFSRMHRRWILKVVRQCYCFHVGILDIVVLNCNCQLCWPSSIKY
jgi:hypothetical protein